jgi:hypothetical protein
MRHLVAAVVVAFLALAPTAGAVTAKPLYVLGRQGGTILPFRVTIRTDGSVSVSGPLRRASDAPVSKQSLDALSRLVKAEAFVALPNLIRCRGGAAGSATRYIGVRVGTRYRTVFAAGHCNVRFDGLYEVLEAVASVPVG